MEEKSKAVQEVAKTTSKAIDAARELGISSCNFRALLQLNCKLRELYFVCLRKHLKCRFNSSRTYHLTYKDLEGIHEVNFTS